MAQNQQGGGGSVRGFAAMDEAKQREIASKGGRAAHQKGTAHEFTSEEARAAGRKGGQSVSQDRAHMSQIGRQGGQARGGARRRDEEDEETTPRAEGAEKAGAGLDAPGNGQQH